MSDSPSAVHALELPGRCVWKSLGRSLCCSCRSGWRLGASWIDAYLVLAPEFRTELDAGNVHQDFHGVVRAAGVDSAA